PASHVPPMSASSPPSIAAARLCVYSVFTRFHPESPCLSIQRNDLQIVFPEERFVPPGIRLGIRLASARAQGLRRHPVVMVSEFVEQDMRRGFSLVGAHSSSP